ncbi:hypothetical protein F442_18261 [Phytophthora nicotianae P10297]|uniref:Uncharacterized protein n=1 Tax=Phytophthora nicotianae P10297 TaxID=1317064 RepID=W2YEE6_PHYNI|nr:hypothetical protein F442_18261 [Phytophthora nicotianae P10297]
MVTGEYHPSITWSKCRFAKPQKGLVIGSFAWLLHGYEYVDQVIDSASRGVEHSFKPESETLRQREPVRNHKSVSLYKNALLRSIRDDQSKGTYLVVSRAAASRWKLHYSPFGCVEKVDADPAIEARSVHDLSYPLGESTNSWSDQESIPELVYQLVDVNARRIIRLRAANSQTAIKLMKGDVNSAFRILHVHETVSLFFAGSIPEQDIVVIDLAVPFGWTGSPAHYGFFGRAISLLTITYSRNLMWEIN